MFYCECGSLSERGEKALVVVTEKRERLYPPRPAARDLGGVGWEIAKEIRLAPSHKHTNMDHTS